MPRPWTLLVIALLLLAATPAAGATESPARRFDEANRLFDQGQFTEAIAGYERLLQDGLTAPALHFNLGNACFKAGQVGQAILHYRLAERSAPRDPDIQANLRFARSSVTADPWKPPLWWQRAAQRLSLDEWAVLSAVLAWGWFGLLALGQLRPQLQNILKHYILLAAALWVASAAGLGLSWQARSGETWAIVIRKDAVMRRGPLEESPSLQTLQDGQELTVVDRRDAWLQVKGASRGAGWIKRDLVTLLPP